MFGWLRNLSKRDSAVEPAQAELARPTSGPDSVEVAPPVPPIERSPQYLSFSPSAVIEAPTGGLPPARRGTDVADTDTGASVAPFERPDRVPAAPRRAESEAPRAEAEPPHTELVRTETEPRHAEDAAPDLDAADADELVIAGSADAPKTDPVAEAPAEPSGTIAAPSLRPAMPLSAYPNFAGLQLAEWDPTGPRLLQPEAALSDEAQFELLRLFDDLFGPTGRYRLEWRTERSRGDDAMFAEIMTADLVRRVQNTIADVEALERPTPLPAIEARRHAPEPVDELPKRSLEPKPRPKAAREPERLPKAG